MIQGKASSCFSRSFESEHPVGIYISLSPANEAKKRQPLSISLGVLRAPLKQEAFCFAFLSKLD